MRNSAECWWRTIRKKIPDQVHCAAGLARVSEIDLHAGEALTLRDGIPEPGRQVNAGSPVRMARGLDRHPLRDFVEQ